MKKKSGILVAFLSALWVVLLGQDRVVVGYYPAWMEYRLPAASIRFENLTHICHAFVWPDENGNLISYPDFDYSELVECAHDEDVKVLVSVGGYGQSWGFPIVAGNSALLQQFIENLIDFCIENNYDGIDIDWEFPYSDRDRNLVDTLVSRLGKYIREEEEELLLTMAVPASSYYGQWFDFDFLGNYVDWFGCMTYDFMGEWSPVATHNSPLYSRSGTMGSVADAVKYLMNRKVGKEKILIGIPFYGRGCNADRLFGANNGGNFEKLYSEIAGELHTEWEYYWDEICKVPYAFHKEERRFLSFDDTLSVRFKCEFVRENQLRGAIIWALGQDIVNGEEVLLATVGENLTSTGIDARNDGKVCEGFKSYCYPNPFNSMATLNISLDGNCYVRIDLYDILGRFLFRLYEGYMSAGEDRLKFDAGSKLPSGCYMYVVSAGSRKFRGSFTVLK